MDLGRYLSGWVLYWLTVVGGTIYVLHPLGADQLRGFPVTALYFLFFAAISFWFFKIVRSLPHLEGLWKQCFWIGVSLILFVVIIGLLNSNFPIDDKHIERIMLSKFYFPLLNFDVVFTKFCDICFQQITIFGLIRELYLRALKPRNIIIVFMICFFALHVPLIFSLKEYAIYFIPPSLIAGWMFPYLLLKFRLGITLSFASHLIFYLMVAIYIRSYI
jgi:hypothetical protein